MPLPGLFQFLRDILTHMNSGGQEEEDHDDPLRTLRHGLLEGLSQVRAVELKEGRDYPRSAQAVLDLQSSLLQLLVGLGVPAPVG
jgi:hypothetical protein